MARQIHFGTWLSSVALGSLTVLASLAWSGSASAQLIQRPGAHPRYSVELEPHLIVQHDNRWFGNEEGFGPGVRLTIPLVENGPIPRINNNIGIGFGLDWAMFNGCDHAFDNDICDMDQIWVPVVAQWNFFFTPVISVFGEVGPSIVYTKRAFDAPCSVVDDRCDDSDLDLFEPVFFGGGRFLFGSRAGLVVRIGWPYLSLGATFLL